MDFEEYMTTTGMEEQTENSCAWKFYKELYKACQQSKQAEINELKMANHNLSVMAAEAESYSEYWKYERDKLQKRVKELELINFDSELHFDAAKEHIDSLQKRIDDLKSFCIKGVESNMLSIEYNQALIDMHKILKGEETK